MAVLWIGPGLMAFGLFVVVIGILSLPGDDEEGAILIVMGFIITTVLGIGFVFGAKEQEEQSHRISELMANQKEVQAVYISDDHSKYCTASIYVKTDDGTMWKMDISGIMAGFSDSAEEIRTYKKDSVWGIVFPKKLKISEKENNELDKDALDYEMIDEGEA